MKTSYALALLFLWIVLIVSACQGGFEPPNCRNGICVKVDLTRLAGIGQLSTVTLTINAPIEVPELTAYLDTSDPPGVAIEGQRIWTVSVKARQPTTLTGSIRFTREGYIQIGGVIVLKDHSRVQDVVWVHVTRGGITPNPTVPGANTPSIVNETVPNPLPSWTPNPTPTRAPYP